MDAQSPGKYQVLNFGVGWTGVSQTFVIIDNLGQKYDLDYIVLGPSFIADRDSTFCHDNCAWYIHGRYILQQNRLELKSPIGGSSLRQRSLLYNSFIPHWNYLRYDRNLPAFMRCLFPKNNTLQSPFYYKREFSPEEEQKQLLYRLLQSLPRKNKIIMIGFDGRFIDSFKKVPQDNVLVQNITRDLLFPYVAPSKHCSTYGNREIAAAVYSLLLKKTIFLKKIRFVDYDLHEKNYRGTPQSLSSFFSISFHVNNVNKTTIGVFAHASSTFYDGFRIGQHTRSITKEQNIYGLLGVGSKDTSVLDMTYYVIPIPITSDIELCIDGKKATVKRFDSRVNIGIAYRETTSNIKTILVNHTIINIDNTYVVRATGDQLLSPFPQGDLYMMLESATQKISIPIAKIINKYE